MKKAFFALFFFLNFISFYPHKIAFADSNFKTDYSVTYTVDSNALTHVNIGGSLTNLSKQYYASSYSIKVGFTDIQNLKAYDSNGSITPKLNRSQSGNTISIDFNSTIVGLNNKTDFDISFDTNEIAENLKNTWNINIPGIASQSDFSTFNVKVIYPVFLGTPTYIKPLPLSVNPSTAGILTFSKQDLGASGISIAFGNDQVYDFDLIYNLQNTNIFPVTTDIALPPTTNYQDVSVNSIFPKPVNVKQDQDGNWLATYILKPSQKIAVKAEGKVKVYLYPKPENLDPSLASDYLKPQAYWDTNNQSIKDLANRLKTPYAIYEYVVNKLNYDFSRVQTKNPRLGAVSALENPDSAVCLEFTDLFITIARAAGIPAREIDGYGYTSNTNERPLSLVEDILHAWPEYYDYDKKTWIMVDPTWGNTTKGVDYFNTLDFNHIVFVVKGEKSDYPIPAGGYKTSENENDKDVNINIGSNFTVKEGSANIQIQIPDILTSGFPANGYIKILNSSDEIFKRQNLLVTASTLLPNSEEKIINPIPPFGYVIIPVSYRSSSFLTNTLDTIRIELGKNTVYKNVAIAPLFLNKFFIIGGIIFVSLCIILSVSAYLFWRLYILRRQQ